MTFLKVRMGWVYDGVLRQAECRAQERTQMVRNAVRRHKKEISLACHDHCTVACGLSGMLHKVFAMLIRLEQ